MPVELEIHAFLSVSKHRINSSVLVDNQAQLGHVLRDRQLILSLCTWRSVTPWTRLPSWEAGGSSDSKTISRSFCYPRVHYGVYTSPTRVPSWARLIPPLLLFNIPFYINHHKPTNALYSHWIVQKNAATCFEPSNGSSLGSHTFTNHTHCHSMITKVGHHLKCTNTQIHFKLWPTFVIILWQCVWLVNVWLPKDEPFEGSKHVGVFFCIIQCE
jgi:hypothetical protein